MALISETIPMNNTCQVAYCNRPTRKYGRYCDTHQKAEQRWGHPLQRPVSKGEMTKAKHRVNTMIAAHPNSAALKASLLEALHAIRADGADVEAQIKDGRMAMKKSIVQHHHQVRRILDEVDHWEIVLTVIAVGWISAEERPRFPTDNGLWASIARRLHVQTQSAFKRHASKTGVRRRVASDLRPVVQIMVGKTFSQVFVPFGWKLYDMGIKAEERGTEARKAPLIALDSTPESTSA